MLYQGSKKHKIQHVVMHTSDTRLSWYQDKTGFEKVAEIRRWHTTPVKDGGRGWKDIGYHYAIDRDGKRYVGRQESVIGAGVIGFNSGVIHICLIGGRGGKATDKMRAHYSAAQEQNLVALLMDIMSRTSIMTITGHNEHAARDCPCFSVPFWLRGQKQITDKLKEIADRIEKENKK